ncbi:hypothetical protein G6F55_003656 [Rhizopus delemar]|nr:hypothetical protein G6F55_003656 [Rhizopus delemar]
MMMPPPPLPDLVQQMNLQRYNDLRFRAYCCGCIHSSINHPIIYFLWAVLSFYFAILAFLQKSPFYSYLQMIPLVAFGAINLLFGVVNLFCLALFLFRPRIDVRIIGMYQSRMTVFAITANAIAVLVVTLVNFIFFASDQAGFYNWCISASTSYMADVYHQSNNATEAPPIPLESKEDYYNCQRLFKDELKWSFVCFAVMTVVYIHWILIIAARATYQYFNPVDMPPQPMLPAAEYGNMAPASKGFKGLYRNMKPSKGLMEALLTHKQYSSYKERSQSDETTVKEKENAKG